MEDLLNLLPVILQRSGYQEDVCQQAVFAAWDRAVGETIARNCVPFRLHDKRLIVLTASQIWKTQLQRMTSEIIFKIDRILGAPLVTYIEYRIDARQVTERQRLVQPVRFEHLEEIMGELAADADQIDDPELRRLFIRAASKSLARQKDVEDRGSKIED
jgi:predicted nucleic acid-binding Zn ribbon protein